MGSGETCVYRSASPYPAGEQKEHVALMSLLLSVSLSSYPQVVLGSVLTCQELSAVKEVPLVVHLKAMADCMRLGGDEERITVMKWDGGGVFWLLVAFKRSYRAPNCEHLVMIKPDHVFGLLESVSSSVLTAVICLVLGGAGVCSRIW